MSDPMGYAERPIHSADIWSFQKVVFDDGSEGVQTSVVVHMESKERLGLGGPQSRFEFSFTTKVDQTLRQIEDEALEVAAAFMRRLGSMTSEELRAAVNKGDDERLFKPTE
jgi:hypothetical protein